MSSRRASSASRVLHELGDLGGDHRRAVEQVAVVEQVGLVCQNLLEPQAPLLVPLARQAERLVPGRQLHGPGAGGSGEHDRQGLEEDPVDVVLGLLLGEAERVDLYPIAEGAELRIRDAVALLADPAPELREGAQLAHLGDEAQPGVDEEADAPDHAREIGVGHLAAGLDGVEDGDRRGERVGELLHRRRAGLLQVVGADVDRVPERHLADGEGDHVGGELERGPRREDVGAARQVLLDQVVLHRAGELFPGGALPLGRDDIEREQPGGGRVDRHRGVHALERDALEQRQHVGQRADRHADPADLAPGQRMVAVVAGLGRQVEGDREPRLAAREVGAVERIAALGRAVPGVGAEQPGPVHRASSNT